jgi:NAD(P)-dependent dehydrogenase (short-subunit alcohol dehydrogenase family)
MDPSRVAIVTGGSSGIGLAVADELAQRDYALTLVGRSRDRVERAVEGLPGGSTRHLGLALNVTIEDDTRAMVARTLERHGHVDLLVASAGLGKRPDTERVFPHPTHELPLDEWDEVINVNLTGIFLCNRAVLEPMRRRGSGQIVNVCSSTTPRGLRGTPFGPAYCASKFGVVGLSEALAAEVAADGVRVQAVFPGPVETPLVRETILARPFGGAVRADNFARSLVSLIEQPTDAMVVHPHLLPFISRGTEA